MPAPPILERVWKPRASLRPFVRAFTFREERLGTDHRYVPLSARTDCFLQFYLDDRFRVLNVASRQLHLAPRCVLVGPHSQRREDLLCLGHLRLFTIHFTAIGFRALFGIPARHIADSAHPADSVLGASVNELEERLASSSIAQMPAVADVFLAGLIVRRHPSADGGMPALLVRPLERSHGAFAIGQLGALHGLSVRQVERVFLEHVGVSPKVYSRLARLKRALALGGAEPTQDWTSIAAASGYFDQAHMIREFRSFNGATPVQFQALRQSGASFLPEKLNHVAFVQSAGQRRH